MPKTARAFAKINLFLDIIGKRDDGYHELDSIFQSVGVYDEVTVDLTENGITVTCDKEELSGKENIVYKACELFFREVGYSGGIQVYIKKNIPVAAGLAGGSADAAAVLRLLNDLFDNKLSQSELSSLALKLGADIPFCLVGGTARVGGIGEKLSLISTPLLHYVLVKERDKQSTGKMFSIIDETDYTVLSSIDNLINGLEKNDIDKISKNLFNAFAFCWDFDIMANTFANYSPHGIFLSGSGPTVCALFESKSEAIGCANELKYKGINAFYAHSVPSGVEFV